jgi:hypothetical protein
MMTVEKKNWSQKVTVYFKVLHQHIPKWLKNIIKKSKPENSETSQESKRKSPELETQIYSLDNNFQYRRENNRAEWRRRKRRRGREEREEEKKDEKETRENDTSVRL